MRGVTGNFHVDVQPHRFLNSTAHSGACDEIPDQPHAPRCSPLKSLGGIIPACGRKKTGRTAAKCHMAAGYLIVMPRTIYLPIELKYL